MKDEDQTSGGLLQGNSTSCALDQGQTEHTITNFNEKIGKQIFLRTDQWKSEGSHKKR